MGKNSDLTSIAYVKKARQEFADWEKGERSYLDKLGDAAFAPASKAAVRMVPKSVQIAATQVIEKTLRLTTHAGKFSVDVQAIIRERSQRLGRKKTLGARLKACDALAKRFWRGHMGYAAAEGAAAGMTGLPGLVADIPLILSIAIRGIRTIALCYGYNETDPREIDYALHVLRIGSSKETATKAKSLRTLKQIEMKMKQTATVKSTRSPGRNRISHVKHLVTIEEYAKSLAMDMIQRRILQMVPLAGVVIGASFNAAYANDTCRAAFMCYRRRFLEEPANLMKIEKQGTVLS